MIGPFNYNGIGLLLYTDSFEIKKKVVILIIKYNIFT